MATSAPFGTMQRRDLWMTLVCPFVYAEVHVRKVYVTLSFGEAFGIRTVRDLGLFIQ